MGEEEPLDVEHLGALHERGHRGRREMRHVELLRSTQRRHQRPKVNDTSHQRTRSTKKTWRTGKESLPVMTRDDDSTRTRLHFRFLVDEVDRVQTFTRVRRTQLRSEIVITYTARVHHRLGREDVLRMAHLDQSNARS